MGINEDMENKPLDAWTQLGNRVREELPSEYQESGWIEMAALLEEERRERKPIFWLLGGLMIIVGSLIALNSYSINESSETKQVVKETYGASKANSAIVEESEGIVSESNGEETEEVVVGNNIGSSSVRIEEGERKLVALKESKPRLIEQKISEARFNELAKFSDGITEDDTTAVQHEARSLKVDLTNLIPFEPLATLQDTLHSSRKGPRFKITPQKMRRFGYGVIAGLNVGAIDQKGAFSFRPLGGLFLSYKASDRWTLQLEGYYKNVRGYEQSYTITDRFYDDNGALSVYSYTRTFNNLNWLELSFLAKRKLGQRMNFSLGGRISHTFSTLGSDSGSIGSGNAPFIRTSFPKSFWRTNFAAVIGVEKRISYRWSIGLQSNWGLKDLTPDNLYNEKVNHLNSDLQLTIRYHIK